MSKKDTKASAAKVKAQPKKQETRATRSKTVDKVMRSPSPAKPVESPKKQPALKKSETAKPAKTEK